MKDSHIVIIQYDAAQGCYASTIFANFVANTWNIIVCCKTTFNTMARFETTNANSLEWNSLLQPMINPIFLHQYKLSRVYDLLLNKELLDRVKSMVNNMVLSNYWQRFMIYPNRSSTLGWFVNMYANYLID